MVHTSRPRRDSRPRRPYTSHASSRQNCGGAYRVAPARGRLSPKRTSRTPGWNGAPPSRTRAPSGCCWHLPGSARAPAGVPLRCGGSVAAAHRPGCTAAPLSCMPDMGRPSSRRLCGISLSCQILWEHARRISSDDRNMEKGYAWGRVQGACVEQLQR